MIVVYVYGEGNMGTATKNSSKQQQQKISTALFVLPKMNLEVETTRVPDQYRTVLLVHYLVVFHLFSLSLLMGVDKKFRSSKEFYMLTSTN
jgi:hypothetical protein